METAVATTGSRRCVRSSLVDTAVLAFDLAADKQVCALTDQDSRVLARRTVKAKAWQLREAVEWGLAQAAAAGFSSVVVACEPTGHRWRVLDQIAERAGARLVCVQPLLVHRARESEDFTHNKNDETDAMIIARLVTELRCYLPERAEPGLGPAAAPRRPPGRPGHRRHRGAPADHRPARVRLAGGTGGRRQADEVQELAGRDDGAAGPGRHQRRPERDPPLGLEPVRRGGPPRTAPPRRHPLVLRDRPGRLRRRRPTRRGPRPECADQRAGALERTRFALADLAHARAETSVVETRMVEVLDELGLTQLATSIPGLSAVGAAAILAETGDPTRFSSARALVKHAGLCPRDNASGTYQGKTGISGRGRPQLRLAAWRAVWAALRNNPVLAARYAHLTGRADNKLTSTQARVAVAGSLLRQLHAVITTGTAWDPAIASGLNPQSPASAKGAAAAA